MPRHTHHYGITLGHRSRHLLAQRGGVHGRPPDRGGRGAQRAGGDPGEVLRRAGARVRERLGSAHTRGRARARLGLRRPPGWQARGRGGGGEGRRRPPAGRRWRLLPRPRRRSRRCFLPQGAAVAARRRKVARAASRWPWAAFKGRRRPAREPKTGRGRGWAAAACSACPAPRPLDGGRRLGREGRACPDRGVRRARDLTALPRVRVGGAGE